MREVNVRDIVRRVACRLGWHRFVDVTFGRLTECDDPLCPNYRKENR